MNKPTLLSRFHADERGTAMTEFVAMLPIFVIIYTGVTDLYRVHKMHTGVQIAAQSKLWTEVFKVASTTSGQHMTIAGGATTMDAANQSRRSLNKNTLSSINHAAAGVALMGGGHMMEGQATVGVFNVSNDVRDKVLRTDLSGDILKDAKYPMSIMLDGTIGGVDNLQNGSGSGYSAVVQKLVSLATASGGVHAIVAGQRYGSVYASASGTTTGFRIAGGGQSKFSTLYDAMVPPKALDTESALESRITPFLMARFGAEGEENYAVALRFGEAEWQGAGGNQGNDYLDGVNDQIGDGQDDINDADDEVQQQLDDNCGNYAFYQSNSSACSGAGYSQPPDPNANNGP